MAVVSLVALEQEPVAMGLKAALRQLLAPLGDIGVFPGETVLLYVGHIWPASLDMGVNPHPALLAALVEAVFEEGAGSVGLAARAFSDFDFQLCWEKSGYSVLEDYGARVYDLDSEPHARRDSKLNLACSALEIALPLLQADYLINIGKFRVAEGKLFGSALGNLLAACQAPAMPPELSPRLLTDIHSIVAPDLHLLDALKGERGYQPQKQHSLFAANDGVALDTALTALAGLTAGEAEHLTLCAQYGLGVGHAADIRLVGNKTLQLFGC